MEKNTEMKKILLVDDDEIHLSLTENMLKDEYEIITAKSGKEALEYLLHGVVPNLILLDIIMPDMDGWETYNRLRGISLLRDVPIAFFTFVQGSSEEVLAHKIGAADYIPKPFEKEGLIKRIETILEKYGM